MGDRQPASAAPDVQSVIRNMVNLMIADMNIPWLEVPRHRAVQKLDTRATHIVRIVIKW